MEPRSQPVGWIELLGWVSLGVAFASALVIVVDIYVRGYRQKMAVMDLVYPITALYWGPVALWFYFRHGRRSSMPMIETLGRPDPDSLPRWVVLSKAVSHCGAGCTLGDVAGEWLVASLGLMIAGKSLLADIPMDFVWAWTLGVVFQYLTIVPMRSMSKLQGIWAAVKADTLSILAFQVGLFGGMAIYQLLLWPEPLPKTTATYWMMMQLSMILGFFTAMPVNALLIRMGVKEKM
jgi:hypothetical protein